jgi:hypothetical protein
MNAKQRQLEADWQKLLAKHSKPLDRGLKGRRPPVKSVETHFVAVQSPRLNSLVTPGHSTERKPTPVYTGDQMIGVSTLHKSNAVPVFSKSDAADIARMRR